MRTNSKRRSKHHQENNALVKILCVTVAIDEYYNATEDDTFKSAIKSYQLVGSDEKLSDYKFAIVMPSADRNVDTISRSERPDPLKIRSDARHNGEKLNALH